MSKKTGSKIEFSITTPYQLSSPICFIEVMELDEELINQLKENNSTYKAANQSLQLENQKLFKEKEFEKEANNSLQLQVESLKIKLDEANLKLFDAEEQIPQMNDNENTEEVFRLTKKVECLEDKLAHRYILKDF